MEFKTEKNMISYVDENGNRLAYITFPEIYPGVVDINHTVVDPSLQGQGIAGQLVDAATRQISCDGIKVVTSCSYAKVWFDKHENYKSLLFTHNC